MIDSEFERLGREHQKSMEREVRERKRREALCAEGHSWFPLHHKPQTVCKMICARCNMRATVQLRALGERGER